MSTTSDYFTQAELSLAAYGTFTVGTILATDLTNPTVGMSATQAERFKNTYTVLAQSTPTTNGFSATLFQNIQTGEKTLAIQGTDSLADIATDFVDVFILGGVFAQEQYASLNGFYQQLIAQGALTASETFSVSGHSLGGFLAQAFSVDYPSNATQTYTYNAPGIGGAVAEVLSWLGATNTNIAAANIMNVQASGTTVIAGLGTLLGNVQSVFAEGSPHSIVPLTDSLAVYNLLAQLDTTAGINTITNILKAESNIADNSLETTLDAVRKLFDSNATTPTATGDREALYKNLSTLQTAIDCFSGPFTLRDLSAFSATQLASIAQDNLAYRYALHELNPFALLGNDTVYARHNTQGELDPAAGNGALSQDWLNDRAAMLGLLIGRNVTDDKRATMDGPDVIYRDTASKTEIRLGALTTGDAARTHYLFGGNGADTLAGADKADHLYGMAGADTINGGGGNDLIYGGKGNDTLNGGAGNDTYACNKNDGNDTLSDTGGLNAIYLGATQLTGTNEKATLGAGNTQTWTVNGGEYIYRFDAKRQTVEISGSALGGDGNSIKLTDIADLNILNDRYGIVLQHPLKAALTAESTNVFADPGYTPADIAASIGEQSSRLLNIAFNQALKAGDIISLAIDSISGVAQSALKAVTGDQILGFDSGSLTLVATEGQNTLTLAILEQEDVSADASVTFKATVNTVGETGAAVTVDSNLFTLNIRDVSGNAPDDIQPTNTISGDLNPELDSNGNTQHDQWGNIVSDGQAAPGRADTIYDTTASDLINAGGGNDTVWKKNGGDDIVAGILAGGKVANDPMPLAA